MNQFVMLLVTLHALQVNATIHKVLDKALEVECKYSELIEVTSTIINRNTNESRSNYVATIGVTNEHYIVDRVLMKISTTVSSPSEVHGLARDTIIFAKNYSSISIGENFHHIYGRGRIVICATILYSEETEFHEEFTKAASDLWAHRFSRMIFIAWIGDELDIFGIRPYAEKTCFPTELIKIATVKSGKIIETRPLYERIKNLNQCPLRIITSTGRPYVEIYVEYNVTLVRGIEGNILNVLSKRMNFTTLISDTDKIPDFSSKFGDSREFLSSNQSDLCFSAKKVIGGIIEPSVSIMDCPMIWVVPKAKLIPSWMQIIEPFEISIWMILVFTLFFIGVLCLLFDEKMASLIEMWSIFLGVGIKMRETPAKKNMKIVLGFWIFFSYLITQSYLASLAGFLTRPTFWSEIDTLEDVVASGMPMQGNRVVLEMFCPIANKSKTNRDICNRFKPRTVAAIFEKIKLEGKVDFAFTLKGEIYKNSEFLRDYDTHVMQEVVLTYPTAFLVQLGAPFLDEMNVIIRRLIEVGFIDLWQRENILIQDKKIPYPEKLRVEHISGIMFVAMLGYATAIIVFCSECLVSHFDFAKFKNTEIIGLTEPLRVSKSFSIQ